MTTFPSDGSPSPVPNKRVMIYRESGSNGEEGREVQLADLTFEPLDYEVLANAKLDQPMVIPLAGRGTIIGGDVGPTEIGQIGSFRAELQSRFASKSIGLVKGGWLPSAIALEDNSIVLPDRCVVAELDRRLRGGVAKNGTRGDFIDLFADSPICINPALFALEGDAKEHPTAESAQRSLDEATRKLRSALPKAILIAADANGLKGILGLIEDTRDGIGSKQDFLVRLNPALQAPVGKRRVQAVCDEIVATANSFGLPARSLVVLAALSAALVPNGKSPAKGVLKFKSGYGSREAYNALADLRSLELLMHIFAIWPDQPVMLCTADKDLALFWAGLRASKFVHRAGSMTFEMDPAPLVPGISREQWLAWLKG
ncbi:MAG: hypothetical protein EOR99_35115 [Mesorhizobium sp.]|uniref:hypothetical protein n=1 Tax=Mesorhizobium sp. TaxID=1871066 RepID=UPI000FE5BF69|nr:hypothetical protein [Mesorhizobium sp.]RWN55862.1 MAG: hypothetical protein EOR99_35115 [Mesorhizobium sp.]RWP42370.1 MAG: hypothetical protein EOR05_29510 [Mesorhizobium sp.]